jgi:hypothetical protein
MGPSFFKRVLGEEQGLEPLRARRSSMKRKTGEYKRPEAADLKDMRVQPRVNGAS